MFSLGAFNAIRELITHCSFPVSSNIFCDYIFGELASHLSKLLSQFWDINEMSQDLVGIPVGSWGYIELAALLWKIVPLHCRILSHWPIRFEAYDIGLHLSLVWLLLWNSGGLLFFNVLFC